ncbi:unnamed protein product [Meganyctiphanes norvegica]|uniref:Uncharacterized protein n=1 Tax=Meganyctiphanes norvegica TaxID=48144 RepID=A0AAV2S788_MEGNR
MRPCKSSKRMKRSCEANRLHKNPFFPNLKLISSSYIFLQLISSYHTLLSTMSLPLRTTYHHELVLSSPDILHNIRFHICSTQLFTSQPVNFNSDM